MKKNKKKTNEKTNGLILVLFISLLVLIFGFGFYTVKTVQNQEAAKLAAEQAELEAAQEEEETPVEVEITEEEVPEEYTFKDIDVTMYAVENGIEVRDAADNNGELIGTLGFDQTVAVVGQCEQTSYWKIRINGDFGYVAEADLSEEYIEIPLPISGEVVIPSATKDILFIGNSITCYPATEDWWGNLWGCGATTIDKDYVHLTVAAKGYSSYDAMSMRKWEFSGTRNNELKELDPYVKSYQYGIVVIELGENAKGRTAHLKEDLIDMIKYIKTYNPNTRIVMMDNFWKFDSVISAKKAAASEVGATYVSLSELWGVADYQLQTGDVIISQNGQEYVINDFLAGHPNDAGFAAMAQKLIAAL